LTNVKWGLPTFVPFSHEIFLYNVSFEAAQTTPTDIKKGVPPYSDLVNLKSNTMKNTVQRYNFYFILQAKSQKKFHFDIKFNTKDRKTNFLCILLQFLLHIFGDACT